MSSRPHSPALLAARAEDPWCERRTVCGVGVPQTAASRTDVVTVGPPRCRPPACQTAPRRAFLAESSARFDASGALALPVPDFPSTPPLIKEYR
jgi:hypothetical protein